MNGMALLYKYRDLEYWVRFDDESQMYEMFAKVEEEEPYFVKSFDTKDGAYQSARVAANHWYFNS